jgi:Photosynthesis system II assembly factor YCF48
VSDSVARKNKVMTEIPKIVSQRLQTVAKLADHPDPNLLGAFVEQSLGKREQDQVLQHLSQCTSCREIVSLSAIQPSTTDAVSAVPASPRWLSWPVLRWGTAVACVVVVGAAITLRHKQESRQSAAKIAEVKPAAEMPLPVPNNGIEKWVAPLQVPNSDATTASVAKPAAIPPKTIPPKPPEGNYAVANSRPVQMADARTASPFAEIVPGRAKDALAESQRAETEQAMVGPLAMKKSMMAPGANDAFIPENLIPRWTLSSDGTLQRSFDSGRTWQKIPVSGQAIFRALSANGLDIWVGGASGALFHSSDAGQHWAQVRPVVNGEALADDIIGVEFRDALHGKLTSSVEETWTTVDAGQTWQKQ